MQKRRIRKIKVKRDFQTNLIKNKYFCCKKKLAMDAKFFKEKDTQKETSKTKKGLDERQKALPLKNISLSFGFHRSLADPEQSKKLLNFAPNNTS